MKLGKLQYWGKVISSEGPRTYSSLDAWSCVHTPPPNSATGPGHLSTLLTQFPPQRLDERVSALVAGEAGKVI